LPGTPTIDGMLVYNTNTSTANGLSGIGIYYWDDTRWVGLMGTRLWSRTRMCTEATPLAVNGIVTVAFADFDAPATASIETCFAIVNTGATKYVTLVSAAGVRIQKEVASSSAPYVTLYCLIH